MNILIWPDPVLKQVSESVVEPLNPEYVATMWNTMTNNGGVGLAAIQVGLAKRFFLMNAWGAATVQPSMVVVNPIILTYLDSPVLMNEGCLSLPGQFESVKRFPRVEVKYWSADLQTVTQTILTGPEAHIFQHEYEHLEGKLFVDKLPAAKRSTIRGNLQKMKKWGKI